MVEGGGERKGVHLSCKAWLTDGVRLCSRLNFEASNQLLLDHLLHISIVVVDKVLKSKAVVSSRDLRNRSGSGQITQDTVDNCK